MAAGAVLEASRDPASPGTGPGWQIMAVFPVKAQHEFVSHQTPSPIPKVPMLPQARRNKAVQEDSEALLLDLRSSSQVAQEYGIWLDATLVCMLDWGGLKQDHVLSMTCSSSSDILCLTFFFYVH